MPDKTTKWKLRVGDTLYVGPLRIKLVKRMTAPGSGCARFLFGREGDGALDGLGDDPWLDGVMCVGQHHEIPEGTLSVSRVQDIGKRVELEVTVPHEIEVRLEKASTRMRTSDGLNDRK